MSRATSSLVCSFFWVFMGCHGDKGGERVADLDSAVADAAGNASPGQSDADARSGSDAGALADSAASTDAGVDPSDALFRPDHIVEVRLTLAPADWQALRDQRPEVGAPRATCAGQPAVESYSDFHGELSIDGVSLPDVAVRKKGGLGSISSARPGLKVDVHAYAAEQRVFGLKHLTLNNNHQDPSLISQCLGYGLFHAAGLAASRCNFAHVVVNGEDLGIYSNVETIKGEFLRRNFGDDSGELYESGGDFLPGRVADFQPKSGVVPPDCSALDAVTTALAAPAEQLATRLGGVLDVAQFTRYWAMEVITDHWDGYTNNQNNFYVYDDPTSAQLKFIPWGIDALFTGRERSTRPYSVFACGALSWRLYDVPATRRMYLDSLRELLSTVWKVPEILSEIDRMQALLLPYADATHTGAFAAELAKVRKFVSTRADTLLRELDAGDPVWPYPADASCRIQIGTVSTTFSTSWGSLDKFDVGSGTMSGTVAGVGLSSLFIHGSAGIGDDGKPVIRLLNMLPDGRYAGLYIVVQDVADVVPGTHVLDLGNVAAVITFYDPATDTSSGGGLLFPGSLTLDSASPSAGGVIAGSLTGDVIEL